LTNTSFSKWFEMVGVNIILVELYAVAYPVLRTVFTHPLHFTSNQSRTPQLLCALSRLRVDSRSATNNVLLELRDWVHASHLASGRFRRSHRTRPVQHRCVVGEQEFTVSGRIQAVNRSLRFCLCTCLNTFQYVQLRPINRVVYSGSLGSKLPWTRVCLITLCIQVIIP
jgi:hypothetical protein